MLPLAPQFILAMEKRIHTNSFAMRFGTSMHGVLFTDVFFAYRYFNDKDAIFNEKMEELAFAMMHNCFLTQSGGASPTGSTHSYPSATRASPESCDDCAEH